MRSTTRPRWSSSTAPPAATPHLLDRGTARGHELRREVEAFAAAFFETPVEPRRATWFRLYGEAAGDRPLRDRLRQLEPGIRVDPASIAIADPLVRRLAIDATELFLLDPAARPAESRERVSSLVADESITPRDRDRARRDLLRRQPKIAALAPGYLDQLAIVAKAARRRWLRWVDERNRTDLATRLASAVAGVLATILASLFVYVCIINLSGPRSGSIQPTAIGPPGAEWSRPEPAINLIRYHLGRRLKGEVARLGLQLNDERARRIAMAIPLDAETGIAVDLRRSMSGAGWTPRDAEVLAAGLRWGFAANRGGLTRDQVDAAIRAVVQGYSKPVSNPAAIFRRGGRP